MLSCNRFKQQSDERTAQFSTQLSSESPDRSDGKKSMTNEKKYFKAKPNSCALDSDSQYSNRLVVESGVKGTVKWFNLRSRYGFIVRNDLEKNSDKPKDVFVHQSAITNSRHIQPYLRTLCIGETVQFNIVKGKKGFEATNVTGPNGEKIKGCPRSVFMMISKNKKQKIYNKKMAGKDETSKESDNLKTQLAETQKTFGCNVRIKNKSKPFANDKRTDPPPKQARCVATTNRRRKTRRYIACGDNNEIEHREIMEKQQPQKLKNIAAMLSCNVEEELNKARISVKVGRNQTLKSRKRSGESSVKNAYCEKKETSGFDIVGDPVNVLQGLKAADLVAKVASNVEKLSIK